MDSGTGPGIGPGVGDDSLKFTLKTLPRVSESGRNNSFTRERERVTLLEYGRGIPFVPVIGVKAWRQIFYFILLVNLVASL